MIYLGTFLIAFVTLAFEVTLTRILSVVSWYHLAFFAVSTAMLGMTAGAVTVYLKPAWFTRQRVRESVAWACLGFSLATPAALVVICLVPLGFWAYAMFLFALMIVTLACVFPFYFSGIAVTAVLTRSGLPVGKLYASDLVGASFGCLMVLGALEFMDAMSLVLLCAAIGMLAGICFAYRSQAFRYSKLGWFVFGILLLAVPANAFTPYGIRPIAVKGRILAEPAWLEKWNSFSRVSVSQERVEPPQYWGPSPKAPHSDLVQRGMTIDGEAATSLSRFASREDIAHLAFDVTNVGYYLRPNGGACIIGVGGGRDVQAAILFGHERIVGIDVNPIFIDLLTHPFRQFAGIADRTNVKLVVDEARCYLSRTQEHFALIQMSLIDTWAATGAGAFSLSENALYTVEAWQTFFQRLSPDGIFTVSRWYDPGNLGETGRLVSLAVASLFRAGVSHPSQHIALITSGQICTMLVGRQPFNNQDLANLKKTALELEYKAVVLPGEPIDHQAIRRIVMASSLQELNRVVEAEPYRFDPPTDEDPYFFNMLRLGHILDVAVPKISKGVIAGNLVATSVLCGLIVSLAMLTLAAIVLPLMVKTRQEAKAGRDLRVLWSGAGYFALIGAGFMFVEIALVQKFSVFLGRPVYALGIVLFTIIASTGVGSFVSERFPVTRSRWVIGLPLMAALAIVGTRFALGRILADMMTSLMPNRIAVAIAVLTPLGILMGFFFPTGMRLMNRIGGGETPWYWALNGIFGVLCSALAVFVSIFFGISTNLYLGALCYLCIVVCLRSMWLGAKRTEQGFQETGVEIGMVPGGATE